MKVEICQTNKRTPTPEGKLAQRNEVEEFDDECSQSAKRAAIESYYALDGSGERGAPSYGWGLLGRVPGEDGRRPLLANLHLDSRSLWPPSLPDRTYLVLICAGNSPDALQDSRYFVGLVGDFAAGLEGGDQLFVLTAEVEAQQFVTLLHRVADAPDLP